MSWAAASRSSARLVLAAFVLGQAERLDARGPASLALNLAGASILAADATQHGHAGFLLREGVWALVSLRGLARVAWRRRRPARV